MARAATIAPKSRSPPCDLERPDRCALPKVRDVSGAASGRHETPRDRVCRARKGPDLFACRFDRELPDSAERPAGETWLQDCLCEPRSGRRDWGIVRLTRDPRRTLTGKGNADERPRAHLLSTPRASSRVIAVRSLQNRRGCQASALMLRAQTRPRLPPASVAVVRWPQRCCRFDWGGPETGAMPNLRPESLPAPRSIFVTRAPDPRDRE